MTRTESLPLIEPHELANVWTLAQALSADGLIHLLDERNGRTGTKPLTDWNPQTEPGFIKPHRDFVAGDFDQADGLARARRLARALCLPCAVMNSGGSEGRAHLWVKVESQGQRARAAKLIKEAEGDLRSEGIRPPGALHRSKQSRAESAEGLTLAELAAKLIEGRHPKRAKPSMTERANVRELLQRHTPIGERSEALYGAIATAKEQGFTLDELLDLIEECASDPESAAAKLKGDTRRQRAEITRIWRKLETKSPRAAAATVWAAQAQADPDVKRSRLNLEATIRVIQGIAETRRDETFHLGLRTLAEALNCGTSSAGVRISRLIELGWLQRVSEGIGKASAVYRLKTRAKPEHSEPKVLRGCGNRVFGNCASDALSGRSALARYYGALDGSKAQSAAELAQATARNAQSVRKGLANLIGLGLAQKLECGGYVRIESQEAHDQAAELRGTKGRGARRAAEHGREREGYRHWRERQATKHEIGRRDHHHQRRRNRLDPWRAKSQTMRLPQSQRAHDVNPAHLPAIAEQDRTGFDPMPAPARDAPLLAAIKKQCSGELTDALLDRWCWRLWTDHYNRQPDAPACSTTAEAVAYVRGLAHDHSHSDLPKRLLL